MASGHEPGSALHYGYTVDPPADFLFHEPPPPPQGAPILSDAQQRQLHSFIEGIDDMDFGFGDTGYTISNDWQQLPGDFMGHGTSFGLSESPMGVPHGAFHDLGVPTSTLMMPPPRPLPVSSPQESPSMHVQLSMEQQPSADVIAAASVLQNPPIPRTHGSPHEHMLGHDMASVLSPTAGSLRHQPLSDFRRESRVPLNGEHDNTFRDMMFGSSGRHATPRGNNPNDVQWGSDMNFNTPQYLPQSDRETTEALEKHQLSYMQCLEVNGNAAATNPSSPTLDGPSTPVRARLRRSFSQTVVEEDTDARPRKRRKSKAKEDADAYEPGPPAGSRQTRKRRSKLEGIETSPPLEVSGKRRRSAANGASKQPRENLTDEQKRENHIKSEQKRRTLIKEGFDDLQDIVPGLKAGGFSKSAVLSQVADFLDDLIRGNQQLQQQLAEMVPH